MNTELSLIIRIFFNYPSSLFLFITSKNKTLSLALYESEKKRKLTSEVRRLNQQTDKLEALQNNKQPVRKEEYHLSAVL